LAEKKQSVSFPAERPELAEGREGKGTLVIDEGARGSATGSPPLAAQARLAGDDKEKKESRAIMPANLPHPTPY
jgi:hypothetical protein